MLIDNRSHVSDEALKVLVNACYGKIRARRGPLVGWRTAKVSVYTTRGAELSSGRAQLSGRKIWVGIARLPIAPWTLSRDWQPSRVARTISHELLHLYGVQHSKMPHKYFARLPGSEGNLIDWWWAEKVLRSKGL